MRSGRANVLPFLIQKRRTNKRPSDKKIQFFAVSKIEYLYKKADLIEIGFVYYFTAPQSFLFFSRIIVCANKIPTNASPINISITLVKFVSSAALM